MGNFASCAKPSAQEDQLGHGKAADGQASAHQQQQQERKQQVAASAGSVGAVNVEVAVGTSQPKAAVAARTASVAHVPAEAHVSEEARAFLNWVQGEASACRQSVSEFVSSNISSANSNGSIAPPSSSFNGSNAAPSSRSAPPSASGSAAPPRGTSSGTSTSSNGRSASSNSGSTISIDCHARIRHTRNGKAGLLSSLAAPLEPYQPHDANALGSPLPACHAERSATATAINNLRATQDGEIEAVLAAVCAAFGVDSANVSLLTGDCIVKSGACGVIKPGVSPTRWGFCGWSFINTHHELLVLENMEDDARVADNLFVTAPDYQLKFYVGAPLISSNGHRLGTLCLFGHKPGRFDATRAQLLANMAELVVRQLERNWVLQLRAQQDPARLARSLACYEAATLMVDVSKADWRVMYMNNAAQAQLGVEWKVSYEQLPIGTANAMTRTLSVDGTPLEAYFDLQYTTTVWAPHCCEFTVKNAQGRFATPLEGRSFQLHFRLATSDGLDSQQPFHVGVPAWLDTATDGFGQSLFFVQVKETAGGSRCSSSSAATPTCTSSALASWSAALSTNTSTRSFLPRGVDPEECPVEGLVMGPLLGRGSYGRVYRGVYRGQPVAVKIIENVAQLRTTASGEPLEAVLTRGVKHLGVMRTVAYAYAPYKSSCWMLFEYCDRTCIQDAVVKGWFRTSHQITAGTLDLRAVAITAYEVASAMAFLHKHNIVHGDLKGGNVMLCSSPLNLHGFTAKVGDFGLSREASLGPQVPKNAYGTVTHMPPEVLLDGDVGKPTDVYSFGVMLWEMLTTSRAWAGLRHTQIVCQVALMQRRLAVPGGLPAPIESLLARCLSYDKAARATFDDVLALLSDFLQLSRDEDLSRVALAAPPKTAADDDGDCDSIVRSLASGAAASSAGGSSAAAAARA